ncbi:hypothetical protein V3851_03050 [Paenibacillus sp. M1]|uniref:Uncharacterized protein n=1 Tax=Paenibacillus haidiansis TaxID=1574488 RepID=A0ABU7VM03_9BACL
MQEIYVQAAAITCSVLFIMIACIQLLLTLGVPWGEITMGGQHKGRLPNKLRIVSLISLFVLLLFAAVSLNYANVAGFGNGFRFSPFIIWFITAYLGLNTIANSLSKSPKEKWIMTPLSGIAFLSLLIIAVYG